MVFQRIERAKRLLRDPKRGIIACVSALPVAISSSADFHFRQAAPAILRRLGPECIHALILIEQETVVRWPCSEVKLYWAWLSQRRVRAGRKCVSRELRQLIFRMVAENSAWAHLASTANRKRLASIIRESAIRNGESQSQRLGKQTVLQQTGDWR